jgi:ribosomal protein S18 acetylase RimI-like enzyme
MELDVRHQPPDVEDFLHLRRMTGMGMRGREGARIGLKNSLFAVSVYHEGRLVGMGRVVGDGGCNFEVVDVAVDPAYQGRGIGKRIMGEVDAYLRQHAPRGAYVSLIADVPADELYRQFGFQSTAPSIGMYRKM